MYVSKLYKPSEFTDVKSRLKQIINIYDKNSDDLEADKTLEDWIIVALYKQGYRIVKTG